MKKQLVIFLISFSAFSAFSFGQDTIQVAKLYKTIIIFPEAVAETILGNDLSFLLEQHDKRTDIGKRILEVSYNKMGKEISAFTNLMVITENGAYYEYILSKTDKLTKLTYNIEEKHSSLDLKNESKKKNKPVVVKNQKHKYSNEEETSSNLPQKENAEKPKIATNQLYELDRQEYFRSKSYYNQFNTPLLIRRFEKSGNVFLRLGGIYYNKNQLYFQFIINNEGPIDYDVNFIKFSIATNYRKTGSNQSTEYPPVFTYKVPKRIKGFSENHFFIIFDKFTLDKNKVLKIELDELNGNRNMTLLADYQIVNRPKRF